MSPICSKAAMRALISIMLAATVANGAALPHEVLDARDPVAMQNAQLAADAVQQAASAVESDPVNFFTEVSDQMNNRTGWDIIRDFFFRLFAPRDDDNEGGSSAAAVTIYVTPTPTDASPASSAVEIVIPAGPSATPSVGVVSLIPSITQAPISEILMSILPVGDLSTAIDASFLTPIFVTAPESDSAPIASEIVAPFPVLNATDAVASILPTAASITGEFPTIPLVTGAPYYPAPANSTLPEGTGIALPLETAIPVVNVTLPLVNVTEPLAEPLASNGTSNVTVVVVTETVTPVPIGTGTAVSVGTGLPIIIVGASPLWPNASYGEPTTAVLPLGTALPLGTGTGIPVILGTGVTAELPIATILPAPANSTIFNSTEPEAANASTIALPYGTGILLATGTGGLPDSTDLPLAATPLFPNTTSTTVLPIPILVTGVPEPVLLNVTIPAPNVTSAALPLEGTVTEVPITVTGVPGSVVAISVTIPGPYSNETVAETAVAPVAATTEAPVSMGTGVPLPSSVDAAAPFANATVVVTSPSETPEVDAGLMSLRDLCENTPEIHTLTLPLISRFYGPAAYPSLFSFPGCTSPNERQAIQAPGLLDCSDLGAEVQHCQSLGKRILLSVKASGLGSVGGNTAFGDPNAPEEPFGKAFAVGEGGRVKLQKRQADAPVGLAGPVFNITGSKLPMGHGPVVVDGSMGGSPVVVAEVNPLTGSASASPTSSPTGFPNLFDPSHPPSAFALTLFSLFGEGHTERADLRPLGPDVPSGASPPVLNGTDWVNPILTALQRPLGEEVVVDGFDVQIPAEWKGTYQDGQFQDLVTRLRQLHDEAWTESGGVVGGPADLGADGKGAVYYGWIGGPLKVRSAGLTVIAGTKKKGWVEWNPMASA